MLLHLLGWLACDLPGTLWLGFSFCHRSAKIADVHVADSGDKNLGANTCQELHPLVHLPSPASIFLLLFFLFIYLHTDLKTELMPPLLSVSLHPSLIAAPPTSSSTLSANNSQLTSQRASNNGFPCPSLSSECGLPVSAVLNPQVSGPCLTYSRCTAKCCHGH